MMKSNSIAVLADSCNDIPQELLDKYHIYILPLMINYKDASYRDRVDITPEQVYERFQEEIPKTSLPLPETIADTFAKIKADFPIVSPRTQRGRTCPSFKYPPETVKNR